LQQQGLIRELEIDFLLALIGDETTEKRNGRRMMDDRAVWTDREPRTTVDEPRSNRGTAI
jgi:hypothetical protein